MYIVIMISPDGDSYQIHNDEASARDCFEDENKTESCVRVVLARVAPGKEFGFGSYGDFYGGEVLEESDGEDI